MCIRDRSCSKQESSKIYVSPQRKRTFNPSPFVLGVRTLNLKKLRQMQFNATRKPEATIAHKMKLNQKTIEQMKLLVRSHCSDYCFAIYAVGHEKEDLELEVSSKSTASPTTSFVHVTALDESLFCT